MGVFLCVYTAPALAGPSGIRAGWGIEINGRFGWASCNIDTFVPYL